MCITTGSKVEPFEIALVRARSQVGENSIRVESIHPQQRWLHSYLELVLFGQLIPQETLFHDIYRDEILDRATRSKQECRTLGGMLAWKFEVKDRIIANTSDGRYGTPTRFRRRIEIDCLFIDLLRTEQILLPHFDVTPNGEFDDDARNILLASVHERYRSRDHLVGTKFASIETNSGECGAVDDYTLSAIVSLETEDQYQSHQSVPLTCSQSWSWWLCLNGK